MVEAPSLASWTGKTPGIDAIHVYRLTEEGGKTIVTLGGILGRFDRADAARTDKEDV
jgi:hypothetical protein